MQILGLMLILLRPKFRTLTNSMLLVVLMNTIFHYSYYYLFYEGFFIHSPSLAFVIVPVAGIVPLMIYYYSMSVIYGKLNFTKISILHYIPLLLLIIIAIIFVNAEASKETWLLIGKFFTVLLYGVYPFLILKMISNFYGLDSFSLKAFAYNKKKTSLIKLLSSLLFLHFFILIAKLCVHLYWSELDNVFDIINVCFLMFLGYAMSYVIISEPKTINVRDERAGLHAFKKYNKSKMTRDSAENNVSILNTIMKDHKPYLDCEFSLSILSESSKIASYEISETLNGLIGQSFNEYVNNYRVEEFKRLISLSEYNHFTILALAFEAGFKSKATFNSSFKKFTGMTPSEYKKSL
jgi:AraC-like DNA-binding protein